MSFTKKIIFLEKSVSKIHFRVDCLELRMLSPMNSVINGYEVASD